MRRNAVRRNRTVLDEEQTKDAVKVLQKYAQQKYRNSVLVSTNDLEAVSENLSPILGRRLSTSRQQTTDRHSTLFTSKPSPISDRPPLSPACTADFITDHSVREEIKREQKETWCAYFLRISKYFYYYLGLKYLLMTWIILGYGLLGGYLFMTVELPNEKQEESQLQEARKF